MVGLVFTAIQCILVAIICAIAWGRPAILADITAANSVAVVACAAVLLTVNIAFTYFTEQLLKRRWASRLAAATTLASGLRDRLNYGKPRLLAAERWLANEADRKIESPHVRIVEIRDGEREEILSGVNDADYDPMVDPMAIVRMQEDA